MNTSPLKTLSDNRMYALQDLHINPTHVKKRDESPFFLLYLNYAVNNICDIAKIDKSICEPEKITEILEEKLKDPNDNVLRKLANFFWLFNEEEPDRDFPNYKKITIKLAAKIYDIRDYFAHLNKIGSRPLLVDRELYIFLEGILGGKARRLTEQKGFRSDKLYNLSLLAKHDREGTTYEFTRKGLIFFINLAQYRDDAVEFTQCLEDMKLPACPKGRDTALECALDCTECVSKPLRARAYIEMFTCYSARRGRSVNELEKNKDYRDFADIVGYLNKVPSAAMDFLSLDEETGMLNRLRAASTESEDNKEYKYSLHKRFKNRFLSFAAGYCEDFDVLPCLKFKRLDITNRPGRKEYFFGKEHDKDNQVRQDRHFKIHKDAIRFAWEPQQHYGEIHIDSLRSFISGETMKQLLFAKFAGNCDVNATVNEYFTAYHRILEKMVNTENTDELYIEEYLQDLCTVCNLSESVILEDMTPMLPYFPGNLLRYFGGFDNRPDARELMELLLYRLEIQQKHVDTFVEALEIRRKWSHDLAEARKENPEAKIPCPECGASCSDVALVGWVFRYFNLYLANDRKFRQLPLGKQHREGIVDHEYQLVHELIGKYSLDPKGFSSYLAKNRPELADPLERLLRHVKRLKKGDKANLTMLAQAAAEEYKMYCEKEIQRLKRMRSISEEDLIPVCRKFGIRPGLPLDRESLLKTVLRIDLQKWINAYDYANHDKFAERTLEQNGHIVSQIPFPTDFAERIMLQTRNNLLKQFKRQSSDHAGYDFTRAFAAWEPKVKGRDFYNVQPLIKADKMLKEGKSVSTISGLQMIPRNESCLPEYVPFIRYAGSPSELRNAIKHAIRDIKEMRNQDKLLRYIMLEYWARFEKNGSFERSKMKKMEDMPTVYDFLDTQVLLPFGNKQSIRINPNDINRPLLAQVKEYAEAIAACMSPDGDCKIFDFYEMMKTYRIIQMNDRRKRLELIPYIMEMEMHIQIPDEMYKKTPREEIRSMEYHKYYHRQFPALTEAEYNQLANVRNAVFHRGFNLPPMDAVMMILKKIIHLRSEITKKTYRW